MIFFVIKTEKMRTILVLFILCIPFITYADETSTNSLDVFVEETAGIGRENWPVTSGIPFPKGKLKSAEKIQVWDDQKQLVVQSKVLGWWPDRTVKWLLLDILRFAGFHHDTLHYPA